MRWDWKSITGKKKTVKNINTWRLNSVLLNNQEITEEVKEEIKKIHRDKWQQKHDDPKPMGCNKGSSKREVYSNTILPQETRKISNKQSNLTPKWTRERRTKIPKVSRMKEIIKIRAEINEIETKKTIAKINKTKSWFLEKINKIDKL